jgi:hypothetical protein
MKYIIYMSTSVLLFEDAELKQLLRKSQANNLVNDVTGLLLYSKGCFVQVIEGKIEDVDNTFARINKDKRHKNIIKLSEAKINERIYPTWSMGFKIISHQDISKFDAFVHPNDHAILNMDVNHPAISILKTFARLNDF